MGKRFRRKLRSREGFSLAETLVAMAILSILGSVAVLGVTQALQQRSQAIALADAQSVASNAAQVITDQLRYGRIDTAHSGGDTVVLASGTYAATVSITLDDSGRLITRGVSLNDAGGLVQGTTYALLGEDAYCGLRLRDLHFTVNQSGEAVKSVDVSLTVTQAGSADSLWELEFSAAPINERAFVLE